MADSVVRWQLVTPEPERAAAFYRKLFAWDISRANALGYRELRSGGAGGIDGGIWPAPPGTTGFVQLFVEVGDVEEAVTRAVGLGAKVLLPRSELPDGDVIAVLLDPMGVSFGLCRLRAKA